MYQYKIFTISVDESGQFATIQDRFSDEQVSISNVVIYNELDPLVEETVPSSVPTFTLSAQSVDVSDPITLQSFGTFPVDGGNLLLLVDEQAETSYLFDFGTSSLLATTFNSAGAIFILMHLLVILRFLLLKTLYLLEVMILENHLQ